MGSWLTPLHMAVKGNSVEAAKLLVKHGADTDERGFQDHFKGENSSKMRKRFIIVFKNNCMNEFSFSGTPLDFAKQLKHKEVEQFLLSAGGSVDAAPAYQAPPGDQPRRR